MHLSTLSLSRHPLCPPLGFSAPQKVLFPWVPCAARLGVECHVPPHTASGEELPCPAGSSPEGPAQGRGPNLRAGKGARHVATLQLASPHFHTAALPLLALPPRSRSQRLALWGMEGVWMTDTPAVPKALLL